MSRNNLEDYQQRQESYWVAIPSCTCKIVSKTEGSRFRRTVFDAGIMWRQVSVLFPPLSSLLKLKNGAYKRCRGLNIWLNLKTVRTLSVSKRSGIDSVLLEIVRHSHAKLSTE